MPPSLAEMLAVARRAARDAAFVCLGVLEQAPAAPPAMAKPGREPVTVADYASQAVLLEAVSAAFPGHAVVAEEASAHFCEHAGGEAPDWLRRLVGEALGRAVSLGEVLGWVDHRGGPGPVTWVVDPIDGTKGFLRRDQFAVAVGLLQEGRPVAGVLACPRLPLEEASPRGQLFWGGRGLGAFAEPLAGGEATPISVSEVAEPARVRVLGSVEASHGDPAILQRVVAQAGLAGGGRRLDGQVKYALVAAGEAEVYLRPPARSGLPERAWDHAAGAALLEAAGGRASDLNGRPLDFSRGARLEANRGVLASNGRVHDLVLRAVAATAGRAEAPPAPRRAAAPTV